MSERPDSGGSYTRAKSSGKLTRKEATKPALSRAERRSSSEAVARSKKRAQEAAAKAPDAEEADNA